jgi:hypothetical protein
MSKYRNKMIINQRGGSICIDNTSEQESVQISHRSGSNLLMNNVVNSELSTNNKQSLVINDQFSDVKNDDTKYVGGNRSLRVVKNNYELKGFLSQSEIASYDNWYDEFLEIAKLNSEFKIARGGISLPNGVTTGLSGERADNPVLKNKILSVENVFRGYSGTPVRTRDIDEVSSYVRVPDSGNTSPASIKDIRLIDINRSAGIEGSKAPGVLKYGANKSAATEGGKWEDNQNAQNIGDKILEKQEVLNAIEQQMGEGGDDISFIKRNKTETVGSRFNDYPSIRIDPEGRSQPFEMLVSDIGTFKNHDSVPVVEEIDNTSNYPCGNDVKNVCNAYKRNVGSGGVSLKTTGIMEFGSATLKVGSKKININASHGIQIASEEYVEIQSIKSIAIRSNRQVLIEAPLGVKNNLIVGGGIYSEGENYFHHITAPLEVQQTADTTLIGQFNTVNDRSLLIGETLIGGTWYPTYAKASPNLIANYPHSHHFNNLPLRLTTSNKDVRDLAQREGINVHTNKNQALPQIHARKIPVTTPNQLSI